MNRLVKFGLALVVISLFASCNQAVEEKPVHKNSKPAATNSGNANSGELNEKSSTASPKSSTTSSTNTSVAAINAIPAAIKKGKLEFRVGEGEEVFSFKPKAGESCKFYNAAGEEQCKLTLSGTKLKVKTADDRPLFTLKPKDAKVMILDPSEESELAKFKLKGDTIDFYLPGDKRTYRIKKKDYGWRLEDNADNTLFRAKTKDGKIVLRDLNDKTVLYSNDFGNPLSLVFFRMTELTPEQQAACAVYFMEK